MLYEQNYQDLLDDISAGADAEVRAAMADGSSRL